MIDGIQEVDEHIKRNTTLFEMGSSFSTISHPTERGEGHFYNNEKFMQTTSPLGPVDFSEKLKAMTPRPSPREDISVTRDSDDYMEHEGLGTINKPSPGTSSSSSTINELLKPIPSSEVSAKELLDFLSDKPEILEKENFSLLLVRKLYQTYQHEIKNKKAIENLEKNLSHQLEITEKNLELKIPMEDVSLLRKEIALLKEKLLGKVR